MFPIELIRCLVVLQLVRHPNIVRLYDIVETEKYIGIILEIADGKFIILTIFFIKLRLVAVVNIYSYFTRGRAV